jgi:hypothetical protein
LVFRAGDTPTGRAAGAITLTASASGLTAATATLTSQAVADLPPAPSDRP